MFCGAPLKCSATLLSSMRRFGQSFSTGPFRRCGIGTGRKPRRMYPRAICSSVIALVQSAEAMPL